MNTAYFDCFSGAGGDMIVAALLDAGADEAALREAMTSLPVAGFALSIEKITKQGFSATRFVVRLDPQPAQPQRHLSEVVDVIQNATMPESVKEKSIRIFQRLARAEGAVHGISTDQVHFHEVGAIDAMVDVTAAVFALDTLGIDRVFCSPIPLGSGSVHCDHGTLPVPAPATAELLRGVPVLAGEEIGELTTPTAAAVLTTLVDTFGPIPEMVVSTVGYGAGSRKGKAKPNLLRVWIGEAEEEGEVDQIAVLETNLDDVSAELISYCLDRLLREGALDAYAMPIHMKKSRCGVLLTVLCERDRVAAMERVLFAETATFGIRRHVVRRTKLLRRHETVSTPFGEIRVKIGTRLDIVTASPEYEDCKEAAKQHQVPLHEVMAAARAAWARSTDPRSTDR